MFQDAPLAAVVRAVVTLSAGAATGPLLVLATERFIATALEVAGGQLSMAAITVPVITLAALFAVNPRNRRAFPGGLSDRSRPASRLPS